MNHYRRVLARCWHISDWRVACPSNEDDSGI